MPRWSANTYTKYTKLSTIPQSCTAFTTCTIYHAAKKLQLQHSVAGHVNYKRPCTVLIVARLASGCSYVIKSPAVLTTWGVPIITSTARERNGVSLLELTIARLISESLHSLYYLEYMQNCLTSCLEDYGRQHFSSAKPGDAERVQQRHSR